MAAVSSIEYRSLDQTKDEIRLLTILHPNGPLVRCKLEHFSLEDFSQAFHISEIEEQAKVVTSLEADKASSLGSLPLMEPLSRTEGVGYMALSYTWGDPDLPRKIIINDKIVKVRVNLETALCALQKDPDILRGSRLWVDMLCINQSDLEERGQQISRMQRIYALAQRVVIWLGPQANCSDEVINLLSEIYEKVDGNPVASSAVARKLFPKLDKTLLESTKQFFLRPYFHRLWILQELAAGPTNALVVCGRCTVPWTLISHAAEVLWNNVDYFLAEVPVRQSTGMSHTSGTALRRICRLNAIKLNESNLFEHIYEIFDLGVTSKTAEEKDRIYGLIGLMHSGISSKIEPTYENTVCEISLDFAKAFIETTRYLDIIYLGSLERTNQRWPTWVPNWNMPRRMTQLGFSRAKSFRACGNSLAHFSSKGFYLYCKGLLLDAIDMNECGLPVINNSHAVSHIELSGVTPRNGYANMDLLKMYLLNTMNMAAPTISGGHLTALKRQMSIFDIPWCNDEKPNPATWKLWTMHGWGDFRDRYRIYFRSFQQFRLRHARFKLKGYNFKDLFPPNVIDCDDSVKIGETLKSITVTLIHRTLVGTKGGFLGLATENVQDGDLIFMLLGCRFPVTLRPLGDCYKVVGEIYIDGIMGGEAMEVLEQGEHIWQEVVLC